MLRKLLRDVGLPCAWRPLEDDLELLVEEGLDLLQELHGEMKLIGERLHVSRLGRCPVVRFGSVVIFRRRSLAACFGFLPRDYPDERLCVEPVAHGHSTRLRLLDEPVEEAESVLI